MLIGIDCRFWNQTGVGRYTRNLVRELTSLDSQNKYVLFVREQDQKEIKISNAKFKIVPVSIPWHSLKEQLVFPQILKKENLDLVHFPYFSVPYFYKRPYVVTIHDLIVNKFNTGKASTLPFFLYQAKRYGYKLVLSNALKNAKKIIVPSESVKKDILSLYKNISFEKIQVTYEGGFEENIKFKTSNIKKIDGEYFFRIGNFYPHKNVENLLLAFSEFKKNKNSGIKLVLAGKKDYFYNRIKNMITKLNMDDNISFVEDPDDKTLVSLYENALATIVPSFMEGFSLTAVEAMSCGSALLLSDIAVHREICKDAAIYFDPNSVDKIKEGLNQLVSISQKDKEALIEKEKLRAKDFSWEKMAEQTLGIYENSLSL